MIVTCENCEARYKLDPGRITGRGVRITCPRCKHVFVVYKQADEAATPDPGAAEPTPSTRAEEPTSPAPRATPPPPSPSFSAPPQPTPSFSAPPQPTPAAPPAASGPRPDISELDFTAVGIQAWKVKVAIGLVYDFSDYKTLARYIKDGRVSSGDKISHDGKSWTVLGDIDDLEEHFFQVYEQAERDMAAGAAPPPDEFDEESPTMIMGADSLAGTMGDKLNLSGSAPPPPTEDDSMGPRLGHVGRRRRSRW